MNHVESPTRTQYVPRLHSEWNVSIGASQDPQGLGFNGLP